MPEVPTLVAQLQSGSADAKAEAAATLQNLAANADNQVAIAKEEGAILALVALVRNGSEVCKENAEALFGMCVFCEVVCCCMVL